MYPVIFVVGEFEVTSFGLLAGAATPVGIHRFTRELARSALPSNAVDAGTAGVLGGLAGAKLRRALEFMGEQPITDLLFSRGGLSWFGVVFSEAPAPVCGRCSADEC